MKNLPAKNHIFHFAPVVDIRAWTSATLTQEKVWYSTVRSGLLLKVTYTGRRLFRGQPELNVGMTERLPLLFKLNDGYRRRRELLT